MVNDYRHDAARYYDAWSDPFDDTAFYIQRLPSADASVLELGCGTGRVLLPMAEACGFIQGVDASPGMLEICRAKLNQAGIGPDRAAVREGDITDLDLGRRFDLITAPFRVMQNLETDAEVAGLLKTIRSHLAPGGEAILNTFRPYSPPEGLAARWSKRDASTYDEKQTSVGLLRMRDDCRRFRLDPPIVYPVLIYERIEDGRVVDRVEMPVSMRVWYADELERLVTDAGFRITGRYGGYSGEVWDEGPELVIGFTHR
ncbi:MAG: class I SAM-dependent methyltransferase [Planctomycetota bacterium]